MALKLRMTRMGCKKRPFYRIIAVDSQSRRDGKCLEFVGYYNPMCEPNEIKIHDDKINKWMDRGAKPSDTVASLLKKVGFVRGQVASTHVGEGSSLAAATLTAASKTAHLRPAPEDPAPVEESAEGNEVEAGAEAEAAPEDAADAAPEAGAEETPAEA